MAEGGLGRLEHRLAQRGVRVDRGSDVVVGGLQRDGESHLGDHLGGVGPDDVRSDEFAVWFVEEKLHEALALADRECLAAGLEGELADLELESLFLGGALGESHARDLRLAVGAAWEGTLAHGGALAKHPLDGLDGLEAGDVGEPRRPDDVAGGIDARDAGLVAVVDGEVAAVIELEGCRAAREERGDADRDEGDVGREGFIGAAGDGDLDSLLGGVGLLDLGAGEDADPLLDERLLEGNRDLGVLDREDVGHHLDDGHLGAEGVEEIGELDADRTGTDDDDLLGLLG